MPQLTTTPDWLMVSTLLVKILSMQDLLFADGLFIMVVVYSKNILQGDTVFYKRNDSERWKGLGKVIGYDNKQIFVRHGGLI